jgi:hypothetical protein
MILWLSKVSHPWIYAALGVLALVVTFLISLGFIGTLLVKLPATYFQPGHPRDFWIDRHPVLRWTGLILKNTVGWLVLLLGLALSVPGMPGQGVLTILIGLILIDFPGKRRLERKLVSRPRILRFINRLRARYEKPPLVLDPQDDPDSSTT